MKLLPSQITINNRVALGVKSGIFSFFVYFLVVDVTFMYEVAVSGLDRFRLRRAAS
jgi:hypothetical protein